MLRYHSYLLNLSMNFPGISFLAGRQAGMKAKMVKKERGCVCVCVWGIIVITTTTSRWER